jgi:hypothetical protein
MADVDVNERLNGLVNLLSAVGIDGVDPNALVQEQQKLADAKKNTGKSGGDSTPSTAFSSTDTQILEIIRKLQQAQADSPEILAALKSPELRALASLAAQKQVVAPPPARKQKQAEPAKKKTPKPKPPPTLDEVMDDDDNYPKIGPGYSDDISVVSDMTTPTVMTSQPIAEEEYYKDITDSDGGNLPPMHIGGPAQPSRPPMSIGTTGPPTSIASGPGGVRTQVNAPKTKNLVNRVQPAASKRDIVRPGGAAAQRRLNYQQAMAKLQSTDYAGAGGAKTQDKSYMENFSPKRQSTAFNPPATLTPLPSQLPSMVDNKKGRMLKKTAVVQKKRGKKTALASQEMQDISFDEDGDDDSDDSPTPPPAPSPSSRTISTSSSSKKKSSGSSKGDDSNSKSGGSSNTGWPAFNDKPAPQKKKSKDPFGDDFFSNKNSFGGGDGFGSSKSSGSDPFSAVVKSPRKKEASDPFATGRTSSSRGVTRDDGQGGESKPRRKKESESSKDREKTKSTTKSKSSSRRASLSM